MAWLDEAFSPYQNIQINGVPLEQQTTLNIVSGATGTNNPAAARTDLTISGGGAGSPAQGGVALSNGLNSNVVIANTSSIRFTDYSAAVSLGGMNISPVPVAGVPFDVEFTVAGQPVTIVNQDASSSSGYQIITGTGSNVLLPTGQAPRARFVRTVVAGVSTYNLQTTGVSNDPTFYAKNFGLVNDGVTLNDTAIAAMRTAVATFCSATNQQPTIVFEGGSYQFGAHVTAFPNGCKFVGQGGYGNSTILLFNGVGVFWEAAFGQHFDSIAFHANTSNAFTTAPDMALCIQNIVSGAGGACKVTTFTPHGYTTGDKVGVYGATGVTGANNDPTTLAAITVNDATNFTMNGTTFGGGPLGAGIAAIANITGTSTVTVVTSAPHGLVSDQLVYINPASTGFVITGNAGYPGQYRVTVVDPTTVTLYFDQYTNVTGSGSFSGSPSIVWAGVCVNYSQSPLIGLNVQGVAGDVGPGQVQVDNCRFGGFKYGLSGDNAELLHVRTPYCDFSTTSGYGHATRNDNRSHSAAGIRIGHFNNSTPGAANIINIEDAQMTDPLIGVLHGDGVMQRVNRLNSENPITALMYGNGLQSVYYDGCLNDGSTKDVIQVYSDVANNTVSMLHVSGCAETSSNGGLVGTPANLSGVSMSIVGLSLEKNVWDGTAGQAPLLTHGSSWQGPFFSRTNSMLGGASSISDASLAASEDGSSAFIGTNVNHPGDAPTAALDVSFPAFTPAARFGYQGGLFTSQLGAPVGSITGPRDTFDQFFDVTNTPRAKGGVYSTRVDLASSSGVLFVGGFVPFAVRGGGTLTVKVQANLQHVDGHQARWEVRQPIKIDSSGHPSLIDAPDQYYKKDLDGSFTDPVIAISSNTVGVNLTGYTGTPSGWLVHFEYDFTGQT